MNQSRAEAWGISCPIRLPALLLLSLDFQFFKRMETSSSLSILYLFFALAIGGTLTFALTRNVKWLDYTVFLFLAGVATSLVVSALPDSYGYEPLKDSILQWTHIDPKLILFAFLPTMLFGEAQTLNLGQVKRIFAPAFLVAVPGAAFVAWLLAITLKYVLGLDWDWSLCWLVGSILSATDPVAVVAVLKNTVSSSNSQKRLTYLIVVEALLNDGSALVLYGIIGSKSANESGGNSTIAAFALYFLKVLTISPALGAALGFAATLCMKFFDRRLKSLDSTCQVVVTIVCAYLSFFIAEYILHVSGVVSCCTAGLVVSYLGMPLVLNHETMETVWSMLEWAGITLIFLLSGLIVGNRSELFNSSRAVGAVFAIYFALFVTRGLLRFLCHLPVSALVPGYSYREAIFATFAGLHGAMSLVITAAIATRECRCNQRHRPYSLPIRTCRRGCLCLLLVRGPHHHRQWKPGFRRARQARTDS